MVKTGTTRAEQLFLLIHVTTGKQGPTPTQTQPKLTNIVHEGNGEKVTGILNGIQLAEPLDDEALALRHDVEDGVGLGDGPPAHLEGSRAVPAAASGRPAAAAPDGEGRAGVAVEGVEGRR